MPAPEDQRRDGASQQQGPGREQEPARGEEDPLAGAFYEPSINQARHEPMPASPHDERPQAAVRQNEAYAHGYAGRESREGQGEAPGTLTPGPEDPASPPTHVTRGQGNGRLRRVRRVARAVRGKPDGEVDPHS